MPPRSELLNWDYYVPMLFNGVRIACILAFAWIATIVSRRLIRALRDYTVRMMLRSGGNTDYELQKRANTISGVGGRVLAGVIWMLAGFMILYELHFDVRPLLAGAGVIGVAIGLGAQSLIKDVLNGFFLLIENQIRLNDVAVINGTSGLVEEINLRTTVLRDEKGTVHVFPNGAIQSLSNLTRDFSYYVFELSINYKEDTDQVIAVVQEIAQRLAEEEPFKSVILAPLEVLGVDKLADSAVVIKARFKTIPMKQWLVGREMNRRIKKRFGEAGIDMPFPTRTVHLINDISPALKEELRTVVREVLNERD